MTHLKVLKHLLQSSFFSSPVCPSPTACTIHCSPLNHRNCDVPSSHDVVANYQRSDAAFRVIVVTSNARYFNLIWSFQIGSSSLSYL